MSLVHALLLVALWSTHCPTSRSSATDASALPITVWLPPLTAPSPARAAPAARAVPRVPRLPLPDAPVVPAAAVTVPAPSTAISTDWQSELRGAASRSVPKPAADESKGSFSPAPRALPKPCKKTPRGAFRFESEKPRTWGKLRGLGQEKEEAYSHLFNDMKAPSQPDSSVPPIECPPPP